MLPCPSAAVSHGCLGQEGTKEDLSSPQNQIKPRPLLQSGAESSQFHQREPSSVWPCRPLAAENGTPPGEENKCQGRPELQPTKTPNGGRLKEQRLAPELHSSFSLTALPFLSIPQSQSSYVAFPLLITFLIPCSLQVASQTFHVICSHPPFTSPHFPFQNEKEKLKNNNSINAFLVFCIRVDLTTPLFLGCSTLELRSWPWPL